MLNKYGAPCYLEEDPAYFSKKANQEDLFDLHARNILAVEQYSL
jgi:hypothetical protein